MLIPQNVQRRRAGPLNHTQLVTASASARRDIERANAYLESFDYHRASGVPLLFETEDMERWCHTQITEIGNVMGDVLGIDCASTTEHSITSFPAFSSTGSVGGWSDTLFTDVDLAACANAWPYAQESATSNNVAVGEIVVSPPNNTNTNTNTPKTKKHKRRRHLASSTIRAASLAKSSSGNMVEALDKPRNNKRREQGKTKGRNDSKKKGTTVVSGEASKSAAGEDAAGLEGEGSRWKKLPQSIAMRLLFGATPTSATASDVTKPQVAATSSKVSASQQ